MEQSDIEYDELHKRCKYRMLLLIGFIVILLAFVMKSGYDLGQARQRILRDDHVKFMLLERMRDLNEQCQPSLPPDIQHHQYVEPMDDDGHAEKMI